MSLPPPQTGILAALWLPTDRDGEILRNELAEHLAFLKAAGIHGVLALGSTGGFPHFDLAQRERALALVAELAAPLPVIANVSDIRPQTVAALGRRAKSLGLPGIAIMAPGFFPSAQPEVLAHCLHAADSSGLPTMLYNFPELTGTRLDLETVKAFAERAPMFGIKQSGREFGYHPELIALGREKGFAVFSGADTRLPEVFALGAAGCIGGLVNFAPEAMLHLYQLGRLGAAGSTEPAWSQLRKIGAVIDRMTFPLNVGAGMEARGFRPGQPKAVVSTASHVIHAQIVAELRGCFAEWGWPTGAPAVFPRTA